jgi:hypothetical protein
MRPAGRGGGRLASVSAPAKGELARIEARRAAIWGHLSIGGLRQA